MLDIIQTNHIVLIVCSPVSISAGFGTARNMGGKPGKGQKLLPPLFFGSIAPGLLEVLEGEPLGVAGFRVASLSRTLLSSRRFRALLTAAPGHGLRVA